MESRTKNIIALSAVVLVAACGPNVPIVSFADVPPDVMARANSVEIYTLDRADRPAIMAVVAPISGFSCQHLSSDPPASKGAALMQLRVIAQENGANAVIDVAFDTRGADPFGTNCWQSVQASGMAVKLRKPTGVE